MDLFTDGLRKEQLSTFGSGIGLFIISLIGMIVGSVLFFSLELSFSSYIELVFQILLVQGIGFFVVSIGYIHLFTSGFSWLKFESKYPRDIVYIISGTGLFLLMSGLVYISSNFLNIELAKNSIEPILQSSNLSVYVFVLLSLLVVGPLEELFFRGVLQQHFKKSFTTKMSVIIASFLFSIMHLTSMIGRTGILGYSGYLLLLFFGGVLLGISYEKTDNLLVPMVIHGVYNSLVALPVIFY
mgnify:CR=1 FL=1